MRAACSRSPNKHGPGASGSDLKNDAHKRFRNSADVRSSREVEVSGFRDELLAAAGESEPVDEHATVVLKRQVPIRFDEAPRSWLGGLPMMPKGAKWPRGGDGQPLHFLAQIACADLSKALWEGRGPRQGWLLLFVDVLSEQDEFDDGAVQVLHTAELGVEHEPPPDMPTVRHRMTDYIHSPEVRPGVPKLWRKWPVDIVVEGATAISAQELYDGPVTDSLYAHGAVQLDRPLTWRGALYYVEGVARGIAKDLELKLGNGDVLMQPPELDRDAVQEEYQRRAAGRAEFQDREVGWGHRVQAARLALTAEIAAERRTGWIARGFEALDKRQAKLEAECVEWRRRVEETPEGDETQRLYRIGLLADKTKGIAAVERQRADLRRLAQSYPGPEGEARLNAEIEDLGAKRLQWLGERRAALNGVMSRILTQSDLGAALPEAEWRAIKASVEAPDERLLGERRRSAKSQEGTDRQRATHEYGRARGLPGRLHARRRDAGRARRRFHRRDGKEDQIF